MSCRSKFARDNIIDIVMHFLCVVPADSKMAAIELKKLQNDKTEVYCHIFVKMKPTRYISAQLSKPGKRIGRTGNNVEFHSTLANQLFSAKLLLQFLSKSSPLGSLFSVLRSLLLKM